MPSADFPVTRATQAFESQSETVVSTSFPLSDMPLQSDAPVVQTNISRTVLATSSGKVSTFYAVMQVEQSVITVLPTDTRQSTDLRAPSSVVAQKSGTSLLSLTTRTGTSMVETIFSAPLVLYAEQEVMKKA